MSLLLVSEVARGHVVRAKIPPDPLYGYAFGGPYFKSPALNSCIRLRDTHFICSHAFACFAARFHRLNI